MSLENNVQLNESIILLRYEVYQLLDHLNTPRIELQWWWEELYKRLMAVELWRKMLDSKEASSGDKVGPQVPEAGTPDINV